ncbi:hypothetical protein RF11_08437 [Thelohanellus kitauei]|uniref:Uncharacterized protein n=1 Tax=Thelohanellus kitauei TaxID=669202 RepID=A0A0C2MKN2_THEKT|nr:hypothetical protein RF11_08437 [Thelohanellus kitauei]
MGHLRNLISAVIPLQTPIEVYIIDSVRIYVIGSFRLAIELRRLRQAPVKILLAHTENVKAARNALRDIIWQFYCGVNLSDLSNLCQGLTVPFQKIDQPCSANDFRPITCLYSVDKILTAVFHMLIESQIDNGFILEKLVLHSNGKLCCWHIGINYSTRGYRDLCETVKGYISVNRMSAINRLTKWGMLVHCELHTKATGQFPNLAYNGNGYIWVQTA